MKNALSGLSIALASLLLCLLTGEVGMRTLGHLRARYDFEMWRYAADLKEALPDPNLPFHHFPRRSGRYYGAEIRTNAIGLRGEEIQTPKPAGSTRVVVLGDSFTLGWGVPLERTFPRQLEKILNGNRGLYEVVNMGIGNYNTAMEVELLKHKGLALEPDIVLLMYYVNDTEPTPAIGFFSRLVRHSYLLGYLQDGIRQLPLMLRGGDVLMSYYRAIYDDGSPGVKRSREALQELLRICRQRDIRLLVVNIPDLRRLDPYPFAFATDFIRRFADDARIPFLDLLPVFQRQEPRRLWVSAEDPHMNELANTLAAEALAEALAREGFLGEPQ